jgi:hypothetical protein
MRLRKFGEQTQNDYIRHIKTFSNWPLAAPCGVTLDRPEVGREGGRETPAGVAAFGC